MSKSEANCQDDYDPNSLSVEIASKTIKDAVTTIRCYEIISIRDALGRTLRNDLISPINVPAQTNSAMDGYAIQSADLEISDSKAFNLMGTVFAGHPFNQAIQAGQTVRIMTGAPMPEGSDTVIMQEHASQVGKQIFFQGKQSPMQHVRQAGEDLQQGTTAICKGKQLSPADIGLLASLGVSEVEVLKKVSVAFFSTGDELVSLDDILRDGQIYDSNRYTLYCMLKRLGVNIIDMGIVPDNKKVLSDTLKTASETADVVITTGGVSVGEADYIKEILETMGTISFWKIAMKPGRPLAFGKIGQTLFFGLPGNPISAMVGFYQFVRPAILNMSGVENTNILRVKVRTSSELKKSKGRMEFQRGYLYEENDEWKVKTTGNQGSHMLSSVAHANCFIMLPEKSGTIEPNSIVEVQPFDGFM